jgi:hypothetical protein
MMSLNWVPLPTWQQFAFGLVEALDQLWDASTGASRLDSASQKTMLTGFQRILVCIREAPHVGAPTCCWLVARFQALTVLSQPPE